MWKNSLASRDCLNRWRKMGNFLEALATISRSASEGYQWNYPSLALRARNIAWLTCLTFPTYCPLTLNTFGQLFAFCFAGRVTIVRAPSGMMRPTDGHLWACRPTQLPEERPIMDDSNQPTASGPEPLQGPHWNHHDPEPAGFLPLRLSLQPGGTSVELTRPEVIVGRHSDADVRLRSPEVSRRHCRFVFAEGQWQVFDLNSMNGVWVNGLRVQRAILQSKDVLHIGSYDFEVQIGPSTIPMPAADSASEKNPAA